jgi:nicotinate-nucleotide adenylyltransferase
VQCIGVFGGTFDPIHYGHLRTALEVCNRAGLDHIRFVPCADPPHRGKPLMSSEDRLRMVEAACASEPAFIADDREILRDGPSYMIDTLESLRIEFADSPLALVLGMDAFSGFAGWRAYERIMTLAHLIVATRPGWDLPSGGAVATLISDCATDEPATLHEETAGRIYVAPVTQLEISSTDLRDSIATGIDPKFLVPPEVRAIILETECYAREKKKKNEAIA